MYRKVLVPLDGSKLAECSLPHIKHLSKSSSIKEIILFTVVVIELPLQEINLDDTGLANRFDFNAFRSDHLKNSTAYLADVQTQLASNDINVKIETRESNRPAQTIIDYTHQNGIDMIVMTTHGYTGMKKMLLGSVAFKVLHESQVPVLLIRPESCLL